MIRSVTLPLVLLAATALASPTSAHVELDKPDGGELLAAGDAFTIEWHVVILHGQKDWDLWYSTTGPAGPWIEIATDLPPGSALAGSVHTYDWTIPDTPSTDVYVRVRQDNFDQDYDDVSDAAFTITGTPATDCDADGVPDTDELASGAETDFDGDGTIDACQPFHVDVAQISVATGGAQTMTLAAGAAHAGELYLVAGSANGTAPGTPYGGLVVPLNLDFYSVLTLQHAGQPPFAGTLGTLDAAGGATAAFDAPLGVLDAGMVGLSLHHAFVTLDAGGGLAFASNAMPLAIVP